MTTKLMSEPPTAPPWALNLEGQWLTPGRFAKRWRMSRFTILRWCKNGHLVERGYSTYCDERGQWFIRVDR